MKKCKNEKKNERNERNEKNERYIPFIPLISFHSSVYWDRTLWQLEIISNLHKFSDRRDSTTAERLNS